VNAEAATEDEAGLDDEAEEESLGSGRPAARTELAIDPIII